MTKSIVQNLNYRNFTKQIDYDVLQVPPDKTGMCENVSYRVVGTRRGEGTCVSVAC